MIAALIEEYLAQANAAERVDYGDMNSVRRFNAASNRMRAIVDEVVPLGPGAVSKLAVLLEREPAAVWAAHHLVEKAELDQPTRDRCFARVMQARADAESRGDLPDAMGEAMWLNEWRSKFG